MSALRIDGKALARHIRTELTDEVASLVPTLGRAPGLAVALVGDNPASRIYVKSKSKNAKQCGIEAIDVVLPATISNAALHEKLDELNADPRVDGILLQLPLPDGLDEFEALLKINPAHDVDGLHPTSQGLLLRGEECLRPCTPSGVIALIDHARSELGLGDNLAGLHAAVVGRSILVGKPVALMLLERHCTVTICHSRTKDLQAECQRADILIAAVGREELIKRDWVKPGSIVIDVGINRTDEGTLVGDVDFEGVSAVAAAVTPVPGGVGPMTIAMLLKNTVQAARMKAH